jgi:hypothetical protein
MSQVSAPTNFVNTVTPSTVPGPFYMNDGVPNEEQFQSVQAHIPQETVARINKGRAEAGITSLFDRQESVKLGNE